MLNFLNLILPTEGLRCWVGIRDGAVNHGFVKTNEALESALRFVDRDETDSYFACSTFRDRAAGRKQTNVHSVKAFWLDVDVGEKKPYATLEDAKTALGDFCRAAGLPTPTTVCSGYGLHVYWPLATAIGKEQWDPRAKALLALTEKHGFHIDRSRTTDSASILRPVGARNFKDREDPKNVFAIHLSEPSDSLAALLVPEEGPAPLSVSNHREGSDPISDSVRGGLSDLYANAPKSRGELVVRHCAQLRNFRNARGVVSEPIWYACLGVLGHCEDGDVLSQEWSSGHPGYNSDDTARKLEHSRGFGPTTCARFKSLNPDGCKGCPHVVTSPIQLGKHEETVTPAPIVVTEEEETKIPRLPEGFRWGPNKQILVVSHDPEDGGKEVTQIVCDFPVYVHAVREGETSGVSGSKSVQFKHRTPHSPWKTFIVSMRELNGPGWQGELAEYGVYAKPGMEKHLLRCVKEMIIGKAMTSKYETCYNSFGWKNDREVFILGRRAYSKDKVTEVSGNAEFEKASDKLRPHPKGSFKVWQEHANKLFAPGCLAQGYGLMCSFGSVLADVVYNPEEGGSILSMVSRKSGKGKSSTLTAIESVWGQPGCLRLVDSSSVVAKFRGIGNRKNLPVVIDEYNAMDIKVMAKFIDQFTGGLDKLRLNRNGEDIKDQLSWKNFLIGSTNHPVVDVLRQHHFNAKAARIFEVDVTIPEHIARTQSSDINDLLGKNSGIAGPMFLRHIMANHNIEELGSKARELSNKFGQYLNVSNEFRFSLRQIGIVAVTASILTKKMSEISEPMLDCSVDGLVKFALDIVKVQAKDARNTMTSEGILMSYMRTYHRDFLVVMDKYIPNVRQMPISTPNGAMMGRFEIKKNRAFIPIDAMREYANKVQMPYREMASDLEKSGVLKDRNRVTQMTAGVDGMPTFTCNCWEIDAEAANAGFLAETYDPRPKDD